MLKFMHLAGEYKATFAGRDNGCRVQNPASALFQNEILAAHPDWGRNEWTGYTQYADSRIFESKSHEDAMADVEKIVIWR